MIIKKLAYITISYWEKNRIIDPKFKSIYQYGVELLISSLISILLVLMSGIAFFSILDSALFLAFFIPIRLFSGGFHANTYLACNISMLFTFCGTALCSKKIPLSIHGICVVSLICLVVFLLLCPVENKNKPISQTQKKKCKIISLTLLIITIIICCFLYLVNITYYTTILFTVVAITILVPIGKIKNYIERGNKNEKNC